MDKKPSIIIVEDEAEILEFVQMMIGMEDRLKGYNIVTASNGEEALKKFHELGKDNVALVVTDGDMNPGTGLDVIAGVRKESDIPIIIASGNPSMREQAMAMTPNVSECEKPGGIVKLPELMANLVEQSHRHDRTLPINPTSGRAAG